MEKEKEKGQEQKVKRLDLAEVVYGQLEKEEAQARSGKRNPRGRFYPSEIFRCKRAVWYDFKGYDKEPIDGRSLLTFRIGDAIHTIIKTLLYNAGVMQAEEVRTMNDDLNTSGRIDGQLFNNIIKERELTELKSSNSFSYDAAVSKGKPDEKHLGQLGIYLVDDIAKTGHILVVNKNTSECVDYQVNKNDPDFKEFYEKRVVKFYKDLQKVVKSDDTPPREYTRADWQCSYCAFRDECWKGIPLPEDPKFEINAEAVKPEAEILTSAVKVFAHLNPYINALKKDLDGAKKVIDQWFQATAEETLSDSGITIKRQMRSESEWNEDLIKKTLGDKYSQVCEFKAALLKALVKEKVVDSSIIDLALKKTPGASTLKLIKAPDPEGKSEAAGKTPEDKDKPKKKAAEKKPSGKKAPAKKKEGK